jgi:hypothetical protein
VCVYERKLRSYPRNSKAYCLHSIITPYLLIHVVSEILLCKVDVIEVVAMICSEVGAAADTIALIAERS